MEALIDHIIKGQEKLEWAVQQQIQSAQADRDLIKSTVTAQLEGLRNVPPPTQVTTGEARHLTPHHAGVALQKYLTGEDPDAFLLNFERAARAMGWPEEKWPFFLAPLLTGEAQSAYQAANPLGNTAYKTIKEVILDHLGLDQEAYRVRFRKERGTPGENPKTLFFRLRMAADKWLRPDLCTKEEILNKVYLEQFMEALPYATQRWLRQHTRLDVNQAIEMASQFARAQPRTIVWDGDKTEKTHKPTVPMRQEKKPKTGTEVLRPRPTGMTSPMARGPQCFECGEWGHIARLCPRKKTTEEPMEVGYLPRTVLYSAELGSTFYLPENEWQEIQDDCWTSAVKGRGTFNWNDEDGAATPPFRSATSKGGSTSSSTDGVSLEVDGVERTRRSTEAKQEEVGEQTSPAEFYKPGGQRIHPSPRHGPEGGTWLNKVRGRVAEWVGRNSPTE
ncbi:uncharacterized protein LOC144799234 [Lissotriton helveticus]